MIVESVENVILAVELLFCLYCLILFLYPLNVKCEVFVATEKIVYCMSTLKISTAQCVGLLFIMSYRFHNSVTQGSATAFPQRREHTPVSDNRVSFNAEKRQ